jgi:hypothetical protein
MLWVVTANFSLNSFRNGKLISTWSPRLGVPSSRRIDTTGTGLWPRARRTWTPGRLEKGSPGAVSGRCWNGSGGRVSGVAATLLPSQVPGDFRSLIGLCVLLWRGKCMTSRPGGMSACRCRFDVCGNQSDGLYRSSTLPPPLWIAATSIPMSPLVCLCTLCCGDYWGVVGSIGYGGSISHVRCRVEKI